MKTTESRKRKKTRKAHFVATCGREKVPVYRRIAPNGSRCFMIADYSTGKRRFLSFADEALAVEKAGKLAKQLSEREVLAAAMTNAQASEYAAAVQKLVPFKVGLLSAADVVADALRIMGGFKDDEAVRTAAAQGLPLPDLANVRDAAKFYATRQKKIIPKRVGEVVAELVALKKARGKSERYLRDLRSRLARFAGMFKRDIGNIATPDVQEWLDAMKLSPRSVKNYRAALATLFSFAEQRGYCFKGGNPVEDTERISGNGDGAIEIFTPKEIAALLSNAPADYVPLLALGAFAGLRSAEALRVEWADIDLAGGLIHVAAAKAKTRSRRLVPVLPNLAQWLAPYAKQQGRVWKGSERELKACRRAMLKASGVKWKSNALRHSFISYRLADIQNAAQVALEAGNSPNVIFSNYRELVKPATAKAWFAAAPQQAANGVTFAQAAAA